MKAAVQLLKRTEELKQTVNGNILNDNEAWNNHQKLQDLYQQLLVIDLEYALDKKVEQDLWNYVFKNQINTLQMQVKDRKNPKRSESQESLAWFLEAASGFYLQLLQELCDTFNLDIPCRRKGSTYGMTKDIKSLPSDIAPPHKSSCLYICQHCLVHLGDIARYRNQSLQAETFYRHAAELVPSNGQPYNQLAILEAAKGDKLSTVFYYVRSIAVKYPFPAASTNLQKMFSKIAIDEFQHEGKSKLSVYDYVTAFLQFHALVHLASDLDKAHKLGKVLAANLTILIATESLTAWKLIQMTAINMFSVAHFTRGLELSTVDKQEAEPEALSEEEQISYTLILELIASTLNGLLLLVYTMKEDGDLKSYYALPVIKLILEWLRQDPSHLKAASFTGKLQIWPSYCKLLNAIQSTQISGFDINKYVDVPLPEDWDLQSFLPLYQAYRPFRFKETLPHFTNEEEHTLRTVRLTSLGLWMCEQEIYGVRLMTAQSAKDSTYVFEAITPQTPPSDVLKQLEEISLGRNNIESSLNVSISPSDSRSNGVLGVNGSLENGDHSSSQTVTQQQKMGLASDEIAEDTSLLERANNSGRIIKIQQSGMDDGLSDKTLSIVMDNQSRTLLTNAGRERKTRQNVALQTIMQRKNMTPKNDIMDDYLPGTKLKSDGGKQVTFKTPSPSPPASSGGTPPLPQLASSTPSPIFYGDVTSSCFSPLHSPSYPPPLPPQQQHKMKPYGNIHNQDLNSNSIGDPCSARISYSSMINQEVNYPLNSSNKFSYFGNVDNRSYPPQHLSMLQQQQQQQIGNVGMAQMIGQQSVSRAGKDGALNLVGSNGIANPPPQQQNSRMGVMGQQQHNAIYGYQLPNNVAGQQQSQKPNSTSQTAALSDPSSRMAAGAVAAAAAQKQQQYAMNSAAMYGQPAQSQTWFSQPPPPQQQQQCPIGMPPQTMKSSTNFEHLFPPQPMGRAQGVPMHHGGSGGNGGQQLAFSNPILQNQMFGGIGPGPRPPQFPLSSSNANHLYLYHHPHHLMGQERHHQPLQLQSYSPMAPGGAPMQVRQLPSNMGGLSDGGPLHHGASESAAQQPPAAYENLQQMTAVSGLPMRGFPHETLPPVSTGSVQPMASSASAGGNKSGHRPVDGMGAVGSSNENMPSTPYSNAYSLFNSPWSSGLNLANATSKESDNGSSNGTGSKETGGFLQPAGLQSLWSAPGPSPLEWLLEQQKQKKDPAPH